MTELARESVVEIQTRDATGTGWIYRVDRNGKAWILTNEHVVRGSRTVTVRLSGNGGTRTGTVIGQDDIRDLAVLTICCNTNWEALPTVSPTMVRQGTQVAVLGYPGGRIGADLAVTTGIVSSFGFHDETRSWLIQTDAAINPGNSGGPMINSAGEVIGIVSSRRDPVHAENIGFAIAMRTVDEELDYLEVGSTVRAATATPTRTPTRVATRVPTVGPNTGGVSGILVSDPDDGKLDCYTNRNHPTVISTNTIDTAAFVRFQVPNVIRWSLGFVYHDASSSSSDALTFVYTNDSGGLRARHLARRDGEDDHEPPSVSIPRNTLLTGRGQWNELAFRTTTDGTFLRLNDETVLEVPRSQLLRLSGWSRLCVGFHSEESEQYSIEYEDLRTRFKRESVSGTLKHEISDDDLIECPEFTWQNAYIDSDATDVWLLVDFIVPAVDDWSFGVVYNGGYLLSSRMSVYGNGYAHYAAHVNYDHGEFTDQVSEYLSPLEINSSPGDSNRLEFEATERGSSLYLNGEKVLEVPSSKVARRPGSVELCANLYVDEPDPYAIQFTDLWAWTD